MARLKDKTLLPAMLENMIIYTRKDMDGVFMRKKGAVTKKQIAKSPAFAKTRSLNAEFGGCSKFGSTIRLYLKLLTPLADYNISAALNSISKYIQITDAETPVGQRAIYLSKHKEMLNGFSFNRKITLENYFTGSYTLDLLRTPVTAKIAIRTTNKNKFINCQNYRYARWIVQMGGIGDMLFSPQNGYEIKYSWLSEEGSSAISPWFTLSEPAETVNFFLNPEVEADALDNDETLFLALGIQFGNALSNAIVVPIKEAGAAKIIGVW